MRPLRHLLLALHLLLVAVAPAGLAACVPDADGGSRPPTGDGGSDAQDVIARPPPLHDASLLVGFDEAGALVIVRADDATVIARRELGDGVATDLVVDERRGRVVVLVEEEEEHARLLEIRWTGEALGAPRELADTPGRARIALLHAGVLVASDADGPRVRLLRDDHEPTRGRSLAPPRSWWSDDGMHHVHGLELPPGGEAIRFTLGVDGTGSASVVERRPLGVRPPEARLVVVAPGDERLVALDGGVLTVTALPVTGAIASDPAPAGTPGAPLQVATGVGRLEGAVAWPLARPEGARGCGGEGMGLAIVTAESPGVVVTTLDGAAVVHLPLGGEPPSGTPYGRRDLAVVDGALFVATRAGVAAIRAPEHRAPGRLAVAVDRTFGGETLRGPLGCLAR